MVVVRKRYVRSGILEVETSAVVIILVVGLIYSGNYEFRLPNFRIERLELRV